MRGGRLEALRQILGHATLAMTMRYAHLAPDFVRQEMARTERERSSVEMSQRWHKAPEEAGEEAGAAAEVAERTGAGGES